jgi:NTE family protein
MAMTTQVIHEGKIAMNNEHSSGVAPENPSASRRPTVALALGAGGAKGLAHIGVIEEIEAQGFEITAIAGTSMGALIGGMYAMGKLELYRDWVVTLDKIDVLRLLDFSLTGGGLVKGEKIIDKLREMTGDICIEELPLAFTAVATDLEREREVWLTRGSLYHAIRASIAIPTVFRPHMLDGRCLLDGALMNPVPVTPLIRDSADYLFAVNLVGPPERSAPGRTEDDSGDDDSYRHRIGEFFGKLLPDSEGKPGEPGAWDRLEQSMDLMQSNLSRLRLAAYPPDLLIEIPRNASAAFEFYRARELIEKGREQARLTLAKWPGSATPVRQD